MSTTAEQTITSTVPDSTVETHSTKEKLPPTDGERMDVREDHEEDQEEDCESSCASSTDSYVMATDILAKKRAHVSKAKARMLYTAKEITLRKKQMELDAELEMLNLEREAAEAEADCQAFESTIGQLSPVLRRPNTPDEASNLKPKQDYSTPCRHTVSQTASSNQPQPGQFPSGLTRDHIPTNSPNLNPHAQPYVPSAHHSSPSVTDQGAQVTDVTRFLLRKDLLFSRLTNFNDRPESYSAWKHSFSCVVNELQVMDSEQMDLLIKYLGPESKKHAISIRTSNIFNIPRGLQRLWERLDERYGAPEHVEASIRSKLLSFPKLGNKDHQKLYDLSDILMEMQFLKEDPKYSAMLAYLDSSSGIRPIISKLPYSLQEKWTNRAVKYKKEHDAVFPPFEVFVDFIKDISKVKNDPGFNYEPDTNSTDRFPAPKQTSYTKNRVNVRKTGIDMTVPLEHCIIHKTKHSLDDCRGFRSKSLEERKRLLKLNNICFKCCASNTHKSRDCSASVSCKECGSKYHTTALHINRNNYAATADDNTIQRATDSEARSHAQYSSSKENGGEPRSKFKPVPEISSSCTEICREPYSGKSCAKILPVNVFHRDNPNKRVKLYAVIDDQSNRSLAAPDFFEFFGVTDKPQNYTISTCSGKVVTSGRRGNGFIVRSMEGDVDFELPTLLECDHIPNNREEIPTPEVTLHHSHLFDISRHIQPLDDDCHILLLIGRDLIEAHHVLHQVFGPPKAPYAQQLRLGWVIIGETCLNMVHASKDLNVKKTFLLSTGQPTLLKPCSNKFDIRETADQSMLDDSKMFIRTKDDDIIGMSIEDKMFMKQMDSEFLRDHTGSWVAPLPFREKRQRLPNNREQAVQRAKLLDISLRKNELKKEHFLTFMGKILDNNHAEVAPELSDGEECWYLPLFGVYHPKKPDQIRGVFDSSARFKGVSLNDILLSGPDLSNSLLGVLIRFRKETVAVTADVQHMFHCFLVREDHRNFLRFLWHKDNDLEKEIIEYRMRVHVFGNSPSPAVATLGLRKAAETAESKYGDNVTKFVRDNFYVDDGLTSCPTPEEAIHILKDTQSALKEFGNLRLHKFASNSPEVMSAFPSEDLATNLKDLDLHGEEKPLQRSLGLSWDVNNDVFLFQLSTDNKPVTRRGLLSTVNGIFDPLGFLAPVTIYGKLLLRKLVAQTQNWDEPLSDDLASLWNSWKCSLNVLQDLRIQRTYVTDLSRAVTKELHVFSDASEKAIAAVTYLRTTDREGQVKLGFVLGKAKVAPISGHTIPRLELCASVLAVEIAQLALEHLDLHIDCVMYYTDSKVVLGYICNESRRFYTYVANRVERIRKFTTPSQWNYVPTDRNPADLATRCLPAVELQDSSWLQGPKQLMMKKEQQYDGNEHLLIAPDEDKEIRPVVSSMKTRTSDENSNQLESVTDRFQRFSDWKRLISAMNYLRYLLFKFKGQDIDSKTVIDRHQETEHYLIKIVQSEVYYEEIDCIRRHEPLPRKSSIANLNPFLDEQGLLRVGGRIVNSNLSLREKKPLIIPGRNHIATLIVRHYHEKVQHQGRHFTEGAIRAAGLWIIGAKRLVSSIIYKCVTCRKLRGKIQYQIMADLPADRLDPSPPFTKVGVDAFGPWSIVTRKTRGGSANSKRWGILFACLVTRAVHIEVVEEMSSSAFINAVRRFTAIRGPVKTFRSDQGTNFVGAVDHLRIDAIYVDDEPLKKYLHNSGTIWIFNPPHASHMGGAWERMIGITRRILDSMLIGASGKTLTHDVLITFMAEVTAIINSRPLVPVSTDPDFPLILTPAMLLTQKTEYKFEANSLGEFCDRDMFKCEWKRVQALASMFWARWKKEYLPLLQSRRKWTESRRDIAEGDVVLIKDKTVNQNCWPLGLVVKVFKSSDNHVRKAEIRTIVNEKPTLYVRPVVDMILLLESDLCV